MIKRLIIVVGALAILFGGVFGWKAYRAEQAAQQRAAMAAPSVTVSSTEVAQESWQTKINAVGGLTAIQGVEVSPEVAGKVTSINFDSGQRAEDGDLLVKLDSTAEEAELRSLQAEHELARLDFERAQNLTKRGAVSQAQLDRARSEMENLQAKVEEQQALIAKKSIRAPFTGELGIRMVNIGQYVSPGTGIVTLQSLDPIYANFTVPERFLSQLAVGQALEAEVAAFPGQEFRGVVTAISPKVEETTRNVPLQATIQNPDGKLRPGMFVHVDVIAGAAESVLTLPRTAVSFYPYGDSVFAIEGDGDNLTAERRQVTTGRVSGGRVEIVSGLEAGQRVVNTGQLKLQSGQRIRIDNSIVLPSGATGP